MRESFNTMGLGLILAIVLVYLLMVANFQSWLEPFIITLAIPGALAGVLWMLVLTGTTINVESLMGTIMAVGVGVANGNLLIMFANELREEGRDAVAAAIEAGRIRLRPFCMTALAMILGMLPMALALGEGAEQNAPLGRAVIGGLLAATLMTLFVVPAAYSILSRSLITKGERDRKIESIHVGCNSGKSEAQNTSRSRRSNWRFILGWAATVGAATILPAGLVLARHFQIVSQTAALQQAVAVDRGSLRWR